MGFTTVVVRSARACLSGAAGPMSGGRGSRSGEAVLTVVGVVGAVLCTEDLVSATVALSN
jgi:hypothetical protein